MKFSNTPPERVNREAESDYEDFFHTENDPEQIPVNEESGRKLRAIHPDALTFGFTDEDEFVGAAVVIPTQVGLAKDFVAGKITERELLDKTLPNGQYDAFYLCSVFISPEFRGEGYGMELSRYTFLRVTGGDYKDKYLCVWTWSEEGGHLVKKLEDELGVKVELREK